ncbi:MAG: TonB-dependent receptor [Crocinitomicaceae bacterium]
MKIFLSILSLLWLFSLNAQKAQGTVVSEDKKEVIPFAKIYFVDLEKLIVADSVGNWKVENLPEGESHTIISASGYTTIHYDLDASSKENIQIVLEKSHHELDKVIVSNNGYLHRESITNIESQDMTQLTKIPTENLGEALTNIPGVYNSGFGTGISKPVIRGLSGSSVVTYINSLRIENQQWGGDHGLPVTSLGIGSVEVIKGPSSLLYGADAMGGVLYFVDEPYAENNTLKGLVQSQFDYNSLGTSNQAGIQYSKKAFHINAYGGYDNHADFGLPNGNQLLNSRFAQSSGKLALGFNKKKWVFNLRYNFYNGRIGLPGHTHDSIIDPTSFQTSNQNRRENVPQQKIQNHFVSVENKFFFKNQELFLTVGNTNNSLKEHEEKFYFPDIVMNLNNSLINFKWRRKLGENWSTIVGTQGMWQQNVNGKNAPEQLIPDGQTQDLGLYGLMNFSKKKWRVLFGGRYDVRRIETKSDANPFTSQYAGFNYSAGFARMGKKTTLRFNVSSGFRAPTTSELLSDGIHHGSFRYEIGDPTLSTEKALQFDLSYALHFEDFELIVNPFYNRIANYTYLQQVDSMVNEFQVYQYAQTDFAQLYGTDFGIHLHPHFAHWLHIENSFSTIFAEDNNKTALPFIPQTRLNSQLKFEFKSKKKFKLEEAIIQHLYFFKQNRIGILETESPAYHVINASLNFKYEGKNNLTISTGVRNLLNNRFIDHLSGLKNLGIPAPGMNLFLTIRYDFNHHLKHK